uniref:Uncharacterized protein n=1 Tax=Arundo donax TaxID=35708 RepID=A0A0A8YBM8_ARUDO
MEVTEGAGRKTTPPPPSLEKTDMDAEDEQVERFYALIANIQAMKAMFNKAGSSCHNGVDHQPKKRWQMEQRPPWRPVFTMEDFGDAVRDSTVDGPPKRKNGRSIGVKAVVAAAEEVLEVGEVVEGKGVGGDAAQ